MPLDFTIDKDKLLDELNLVAAVVEKKTTIPILSNVRLSAEEQFTLNLQGTDLASGIVTKIDANVRDTGAVCLPSVRLAQLVRTFPDGDVKIKIGENYWATITAGKTRARLAGVAAEGFPELPPAPKEGAPINARVLANQMALVGYAISDEESRFNLRGFLMVMGEQLNLVATDSHRLCWAQARMDAVSPQKLLVPEKIISQYEKLIEKAESGAMVVVSQDDNHIYFTVGDRLLLCRKLTGNFPDYGRVMPAFDRPMLRTFIRQDLRAAIQQVLQFADDKSHKIIVEFVDGELKLFGNAVETGECESAVEAVGDNGANFSVALNGGYLLETLTAIQREKVDFSMDTGFSAIEIRPHAESSYRAILMPMHK